jgi:hypothetical protein
MSKTSDSARSQPQNKLRKARLKAASPLLRRGRVLLAELLIDETPPSAGNARGAPAKKGVGVASKSRPHRGH